MCMHSWNLGSRGSCMTSFLLESILLDLANSTWTKKSITRVHHWPERSRPERPCQIPLGPKSPLFGFIKAPQGTCITYACRALHMLWAYAPQARCSDRLSGVRPNMCSTSILHSYMQNKCIRTCLESKTDAQRMHAVHHICCEPVAHWPAS